MWTYSDGVAAVKAYWSPGGAGRAGSWALADQATGNAQGVVPAGEFSRRFRPVDVFADVPGFPTYLGTVTAPDGSALVDLVLDRNPFMLANGPRRAARPHVLMVPRRHRDGWSSATPAELTACQAAMTLVAAWYRSLDGGHVVFCANDSPPNLDYLRDAGSAPSGTPAGREADAATTRNPRQEVQHAHLHAFYAEGGETENHESSALTGYAGRRPGPARRSATPSAATRCRSTGTARRSRPTSAPPHGPGAAVTARTSSAWTALSGSCLPWGRPRTSSTGASPGPTDSRRARPEAGRRRQPGPARPGRCRAARHAARRATAQQRAGFETFLAQRGLNARSIPSS